MFIFELKSMFYTQFTQTEILLLLILIKSLDNNSTNDMCFFFFFLILILIANLIHSFFPSLEYAFILPAIFGVIFLGGIVVFTLYHIWDFIKTTSKKPLE